MPVSRRSSPRMHGLLSIGLVIVFMMPSIGSGSSEVDAGTVILDEDLSIGSGTGDVVIGFITAACVDSSANIYATDLRMQCIYKFDADGRHIETYGKPGDGPGDLPFGVVMAMDSRSRMYITGMGGSVQSLDTEWSYLGEFSREHPDNIARSIAVSDLGYVYIAAVDLVEQTAFDAYDPSHVFLGSHSETFGAGKDVDWRLESLFAGGHVAVGPAEEVYYAQMTPYEVRKFDAALRIVGRSTAGGAGFVPPPPEVDFSGQTVHSSLDGAASGITVLRTGDVVVSAYRKEADERTVSRIMLYDADLRLLATRDLDGIFAVAGRDRSDRVFFSVKDDDGSRLVRVGLSHE